MTARKDTFLLWLFSAFYYATILILKLNLIQNFIWKDLLIISAGFLILPTISLEMKKMQLVYRPLFVKVKSGELDDHNKKSFLFSLSVEFFNLFVMISVMGLMLQSLI